MRTVRMVRSDPLQGPRVIDAECSLQSLRDLIGGGWLEGRRVPYTEIAVYCDDEGLLKGLRPSVVDRRGRVLFRGPVLFFRPDGEGDESDLPMWVADNIVRSVAKAKDEDGTELRVVVMDAPFLPTGSVELEESE